MGENQFVINIDAGDLTGIDDLLKKIDSLCDGGGTKAVWLRGHRNYAWELKPSIGRPYCFAGFDTIFSEKQETAIFHRFRRFAYTHLGRVLGEWESLFLARHHNLPVRLLDWSANPLVALYFAACHFEGSNKPEPEDDGAVWAIVRKHPIEPIIDVLSEDISPFSVKGVRIIYPTSVSPRITVQNSAFTIQENPWTELHQHSLQKKSKKDIDIEKLVRWRVPRARKLELLRQLERIDINAKTLFPDLDGLATGICHNQVLRNESH